MVGGEGPMDQLLREQMRVFTEAENVLAERKDPDDTRTALDIAAENKDELILLYQQMCDADPVVQSLIRQQWYDKLAQLLLDAATDCDERGHPRNVSARFRNAAAVCDLARRTPG